MFIKIGEVRGCMKKLERIANKIVYPFAGVGIGLTLMYLLPAIFPSFCTGIKIDRDRIEITKRKGALSMFSIFATPETSSKVFDILQEYLEYKKKI